LNDSVWRKKDSRILKKRDRSQVVQEEQSFDSSDVRTGTQTTWLHADHLNMPRIGTDDSQAVVWI
jgi:hypothetical protein